MVSRRLSWRRVIARAFGGDLEIMWTCDCTGALFPDSILPEKINL